MVSLKRAFLQFNFASSLQVATHPRGVSKPFAPPLKGSLVKLNLHPSRGSEFPTFSPFPVPVEEEEAEAPKYEESEMRLASRIKGTRSES